MAIAGEADVGRPADRAVRGRGTAARAGRFMDDLDPLPHAGHAAIVRSPFAHARSRSTRRPRRGAGGARGRDGRRGRALSGPFPSALGSRHRLRRRRRVARYVGEPLAVVVARDRYLAEDAAELVLVDYDPLERSRRRDRAPSRSTALVPLRRPGGRARPGRLVVRERSACRARRPPVECYGVIATGTRRGPPDGLGEFPGPVHAARRRRGRTRHPGIGCGCAPRPTGAARTASSRPSTLRRPVASRRGRSAFRCAGRRTGRAPCRERGRDGAADRGRGGLHPDGKLLGLRSTRSTTSAPTYGRPSRPRSTACTARSRAPIACRTWLRETASRHEPLPSGLNRGFGGPQLYFALERTMAIAARRLGLDPAELARRNLVAAASMPYRRRRARSRLRRLRRLPRRRARPRRLLRAAGLHAGCARRGPARRGRARLRRRAVVSNMGYITLAQTPAERDARSPSRGTSRGPRSRSPRTAG